MAVRGLKDPNDIDIVVMEPIFEKCREGGWEVLPWTYAGRTGNIFLRRGLIELYLDVNEGDFQPTTEELIRRADIIEGIPFASLEDTKRFKRAYGGPKHLKDVAMVEEYERDQG